MPEFAISSANVPFLRLLLPFSEALHLFNLISSVLITESLFLY